MKKTTLMFLAGLIFLLGSAIFSYPFLAAWLYKRSALEVQVTYQEKLEEHTKEELEELLKAAKEYNEALWTSGMILTEPFDPERYDVDAMYLKLPTENPEIGYVSIPILDVTLPIYHTTSNEVLELGAGHMPHTSLPIGGESTHAAISAHRGLPNAERFTHLDRLREGNLFIIEILGETLTYQVYEIEEVLPDQVEALAIQPGEDLVTLITCTPLGINTRRLLVHGKRVPDENLEQASEEEPELVKEWTYTDIVTIAAVVIGILFLSVFLFLLLFGRQKKKEENEGEEEKTGKGEKKAKTGKKKKKETQKEEEKP